MPIRDFFLFAATALLASPLLSCEKQPPPFECADAIGCVEIAPGEPVKIGVLQALSGGVTPLGLTQKRAVQLAVEHREEHLLSHPIELVVIDSKCNAEGGRLAALKVVADPEVLGAVGTSCSESATTAGAVLSDAGLVMISGINSAPSLTAIAGKKGDDWRPGFFRTTANDFKICQASATFVLKEMGITRVATLNDGDAYTRGLTLHFGEIFKGLGGSVVLETTINKGDKNMRPVLEAVAASGAQLLFFPLFQPEGDLVILQAREMEGLENLALLSTTGFMTGDFLKKVGQKAQGMYFVAVSKPRTAAIGKLLSDYEAKYGEPPQHIAYSHGYDATVLLLKAIEEVAVQEVNGKLHIGRQALRDALYAVSGFDGATGTLSCDEFGDCSTARVDVLRLDDPVAGLGALRSNVIYSYPPAGKEQVQ